MQRAYVLTGERFAGILLTAALVNVVSIALMLRRLGRTAEGPRSSRAPS
jgi:hypothetical protein